MPAQVTGLVYREASPGCRSAWYQPRHEPVEG